MLKGSVTWPHLLLLKVSFELDSFNNIRGVMALSLPYGT
uniref:Uncharacterized protein n=1 Tax=Scytodes thoracica TaxID=1112478 RepID=A0A0A0VA26_SCYTH|nr:hypothetical protein [Scytodes thoracica]